MVTTPQEVAEALIGVGVPDDRAHRIAHAVDPSHCALGERELAQSIEAMRIGMRMLQRAISLSNEGMDRRPLLDWQDAIFIGLQTAEEARWERVKEKWDAQTLRAERQHRQKMLAILGLGVLNLFVWTALLVMVFLVT